MVVFLPQLTILLCTFTEGHLGRALSVCCACWFTLHTVQYLEWINKTSLTARSLINPACTAQQLCGGWGGGVQTGMPGLSMFTSTIRLEQGGVSGE